jgi:uncharacterized membrane protein YkgB
MERLFELTDKVAPRLLRWSLALVLLWIGALKFADPTPVVGLLEASLSFLAFPAFVYVLGVFEVGAALLLFFGAALRYVGILTAGLFVGTLLIFLIAPGVSYGEAGFPSMTLAGEFLLKDAVLLSAALMVARSSTRDPAIA